MSSTLGMASRIPGDTMPIDRAPGHWVLARLGKRVLRPGGVELTRSMLAALKLAPGDRVVEFAPGLGASAHLCLHRDVASYTGIDRDQIVLARLNHRFSDPRVRFVLGNADDTGLESGAFSVVFGEAMLSMQTDQEKFRIVTEAARLLAPGGRYGLHELCAMPDDIDAATQQRMQADLLSAVHHQVRLLTAGNWHKMLASAGFEVETELRAPMHLLEPSRIISDEGLSGAARVLFNAIRHPGARKRMLAMRDVFRTHHQNLGAIAFVARKVS